MLNLFSKKKKEFWDMCKSGDIVYPSAVQRFYSCSKEESYEKCENEVRYCRLKRIFMIKCLSCNRFTSSEKYDSLCKINLKEHINCQYCDIEFLPSCDNVEVLYEKK